MDVTEEESYCHALIEPLIEYPEKFTVDRTVDEIGTLLTLNLAREDTGKIIGRQGETARSIRHILMCFGARRRIRISMKINEPNRESFNVI